MLASELRRHGVDGRVVERAPAPTDKSNAVILHARTIEHLDQVALANAFIEHGVSRCTECRSSRSWAQLTAFFTSALILASSVAVNSVSAKEVGHMAPSSRFPPWR
jgi:2-polyprenyl-6-methoxyphenol hydroxylase-like FAD-dependent oxidoreductase